MANTLAHILFFFTPFPKRHIRAFSQHAWILPLIDLPTVVPVYEPLNKHGTWRDNCPFLHCTQRSSQIKSWYAWTLHFKNKCINHHAVLNLGAVAFNILLFCMWNVSNWTSMPLIFSRWIFFVIICSIDIHKYNSAWCHDSWQSHSCQQNKLGPKT